VEVSEWLRKVKASPLGPHATVRGSQLTQVWLPERRAQDVDHLLLGEWTVGRVRDLLAELAPRALLEVTWVETKSPGVRLSLPGLQVDVGWGDPLVVPPVPMTVAGVEVQGVRPEIMLAWKLHGLVEHGRGKWHAKTLADVVLFLRKVKLDEELVLRALRVAFESRETPLSALDPLLNDATWGTSRGSRNKWKSYRKKAAWVTFELGEAIAEVKSSRLLRMGLLSGQVT
jgi:hypothetical protein